MNESCSCEPCAYEDGTQVHQLDGITVRDESYITPLKVKHIALTYRLISHLLSPTHTWPGWPGSPPLHRLLGANKHVIIKRPFQIHILGSSALPKALLFTKVLGKRQLRGSLNPHKQGNWCPDPPLLGESCVLSIQGSFSNSLHLALLVQRPPAALKAMKITCYKSHGHRVHAMFSFPLWFSLT